MRQEVFRHPIRLHRQGVAHTLEVRLAPDFICRGRVAALWGLLTFEGLLLVLTEDDSSIILAESVIELKIDDLLFFFDDAVRELILCLKFFVMSSALSAGFSADECSHIIEKRIRSK